MRNRTFDNPWRPVYEAYAASVWLISLILMLLFMLSTSLPQAPFWVMGSIAVVRLVMLTFKSIKLWRLKLSLAGRSIMFMKPKQVLTKVKNTSGLMWLGTGFEWTPVHTARALELRKRPITDIVPPRWVCKLMGVDTHPDQGGLMGIGAKRSAQLGAPWIHGLEPDEEDIYISHEALAGHTIVFGTTGAGKTRLMETMLVQCLAANEVVFIIDPKGDKGLRDMAEATCREVGRTDAFCYFHPAFPSHSVRIDPLKNWNRETEPASRIAGLLPSEGGGDAFTQFAWRTINLITQGILYCEKRPTIAQLRRYVEGGAEKLMEKVFEAYFKHNVENWEFLTKKYITAAEKAKSRQVPAGSVELHGYMAFYATEIPDAQKDSDVDGLLSLVTHQREHAVKMLAVLTPTLVMLDSGDLGKLLSPDASDITDKRPIMDTTSIINGGMVFYMGLDSLSDSTVSAALAAMLLADLAAVAGDRYNYGGRKVKIRVFVDEASEAVTNQLLQLLNKGRGADFAITLFAQTLSDLVTKLGSDDKAKVVLGNCNNLIALRTKDAKTQEYICESFGETHVQTVSKSQSSGNRSDDSGLHITANVSDSLSEERVGIFSQELLGMLPNMQYIASVAGGRIIKGRLPILEGK